MRAHKYNVSDSSARTVDGITFASAAESRRYGELRMIEMAGHITGLTIQPEFELQPAYTHGGKRERAITYRADFGYDQDGQRVIEDVKGVRTQVFKIKRKLLLYHYPDIDFREVSA